MACARITCFCIFVGDRVGWLLVVPRTLYGCIRFCHTYIALSNVHLNGWLISNTPPNNEPINPHAYSWCSSHEQARTGGERQKPEGGKEEGPGGPAIKAFTPCRRRTFRSEVPQCIGIPCSLSARVRQDRGFSMRYNVDVHEWACVLPTAY
eukprot:GDKI01025570.1.p1 GENE.GDKI01025570.1~~GDKI01025570.1.p1  ORF type:complete len:151 (+),score=0.60 GDKI01025570.1:174-626(+)